ncbi:hypothetical protein [Tepidibacter sp. Z1-5]|uniref:hypothetical protein n=1 Tax=Tepidibacter sp. Z1-5 TaxID=3134138 RepID=UPI0030BF970A
MSKKIENIDDATKIINTVSSSFIALAILQLVILVIFLGNYYAILDVIIIIVIASLLKKFKNITFAIIMFLISLASLVSTVMNRIGLSEGGQNIYLTVIMVLMSVKAIRATWFIRKAKKEEKLNI